MRYPILFIAICVLVIGTLFILGGAKADTIIVDDDWSGADYNTIAGALGAAEEGDTIRVYDGTYNEANDVIMSLNLIGNGTSTIIDGYKKDHVFGFNLMGGDTNVSGFYFYRWWPTHHYGGVGVYSDGNRITDNTFYRNGRGIFLGGCRDNVIFNNTFDKGYYDVLVYEGAHETRISFNTFSSVYAYSISIGRSNDVEIFSNTFYYDYRGGGVSVHRGENVTMAYNMFNGALGDPVANYGARLYDMKSGRVHNNTFLDVNVSLSIVGTKNFTIADNTIVNGSTGMLVGRLWSGRHQLGDWCNGTQVRNNNIINQGVYGFDATYGQVTPIDARLNWWGDSSGPYHPVNNSNGVGSNASDLVTFDKWLGSMNDGLPPIAYIFHVMPALVNEGEAVFFEGRGLARNTTVEHVWTSSLDGELYRGSDMAFTATDLSPGRHTIFLKVLDIYGKWSSKVSVEVRINGLPIASIVSIERPLVNDGEEVTFKGRYVDFEDDVRELVWTSDIDGEIGRTTDFTLTNLTNGTHTITFQVRDGFGVWSNLATAEVIVNGRPLAFIESIEHPFVNESESVIFRGDFVDAEDGVVGHWWESDLDGFLSDQLSFFTSSLSNGTHEITFRVQDDFEVWSRNTTATVVVNGLPQAFIISVSPDLAVKGSTVTFKGGYLDHENSIQAYEWASDLQGIIGHEEVFSSNNLVTGIHLISFRVKDGNDVWSPWALTVLQVYGRPTAWIISHMPDWVNEGDTVRLEGGFEDPQGDVRRYQWVSDIDGEVGVAWNLTTATLSNGTHTISYRVMNALGAWSEEATVTITVNGLPRGHIVEVDPTSANEGDDVKLVGTYTDHEDRVLLVEWSSSIDGLLGEDLWLTTSGLSNGTHVVSFRVMDHREIWSEPDLMAVHVNGRPRAHIESVGPEGEKVGTTVHFSGWAEDDLAVVAYSWRSSIDGGLSDISVFSTGDLSPGTHEITFLAQDNEGVWSDASSVTFTVVGIDERVEISSIDLPAAALEGDDMTLGCTLVNVGNVPLLGLSVTFSIGDVVVGTVPMNGPLHPGAQRPVETTWVAPVGRHVVLVEVVHRGVVLRSELSDGTITVEPRVVLDDPPTETPMPEEGEGIEDGNDMVSSAIIIVAFAVVIAVVYMDRVRRRPPRWEDE
jgi:parallel beta-helix repeat protein